MKTFSTSVDTGRESLTGEGTRLGPAEEADACACALAADRVGVVPG